MWLGLLGIAMFSLTLPFTRLAVAELNPVLVACGRAFVAGTCSVVLLWHKRASWPTGQQWRALAITAAGVIIGFPVFMSIAMYYVPASHGAIVLGLLPLMTALFGALRFGERPSLGFWLAALAGSALVTAFALQEGGGEFHIADLALLIAVISASMGYAEGGRLARTMSGPDVICWAMVLSIPLAFPATLFLLWHYGAHASLAAWGSFSYLALFSALIGFFFWYRGLALGGIARVGQVQLMQPFLTLLGAMVLLGEPLKLSQFAFAIAIIAVVAVGRKMTIRQAPQPRDKVAETG